MASNGIKCHPMTFNATQCHPMPPNDIQCHPMTSTESNGQKTSRHPTQVIAHHCHNTLFTRHFTSLHCHRLLNNTVWIFHSDNGGPFSVANNYPLRCLALGCLWVSLGIFGWLWVLLGAVGCYWLQLGVVWCLWFCKGVCPASQNLFL